MVDFGPNPVSFYKVCEVKVELEELMGKQVDVVPSPLSEDTLLEIDKEVLLYEQPRHKNSKKLLEVYK